MKSENRPAKLQVAVRPEIQRWLYEKAQKGFRTISAEVAMRLEAEYQKEFPKKPEVQHG